MEQSPRLSLSYIAPSQAQKHVTVNETFRRLDALVQLTVRSRIIAAEPASPVEGDAYILPASPTGAVWSGYGQHNLAVFQDGAWSEILASDGLRAWVSSDNELVAFNGASWAVITGGGAGEAAAKFGVNTTADATNRLSVKSDAVLFSHDDVTPGNDDCIIKVNKKAAADTASHLFQTGFSGRAEFGLAGDDNFHIKVSPDNFTTTYDALRIDKDNGNVGHFVDPEAQLHILAQVLTPTTGDFHLEKDGGANTAFTQAYFSTYAAGTASSSPFNVWRRSRGTKAAPSAVVSGDWIGGCGFHGYSNGSFQQRSLISVTIDDTVSGDTIPMAMTFRTGTTSAVERMKIASDGGVVIGTPSGGSKGVGTLNASAVYDDNALLSCYVFDQALDKRVDFEKWDNKVPDLQPASELEGNSLEERAPGPAKRRSHYPMRRFSARIGTSNDPLTLDGYAKHWKEKRHLTSMPNEASFDPVKGMATGEWVQRLVETVEIQAVLIEKLNTRLKIIEQTPRIGGLKQA